MSQEISKDMSTKSQNSTMVELFQKVNQSTNRLTYTQEICFNMELTYKQKKYVSTIFLKIYLIQN